MSEDEKLLMLAAKAEGREPPIDANGVWSAWVGSPESGHWWNPLEDDGDALRLAMKLRMTVEQSMFEIKSSAFIPQRTTRSFFNSVSGNVTRDKATRRAIVLTAAAFAKATA